MKAYDVILVERDRDAAHVYIQVRGMGEPGHRPLLGEIVCSPDEAAWFAAAIGLRSRDDA